MLSNTHLIFGLIVGFVLMGFGSMALLLAPVGWSLVVVGAGIAAIAVGFHWAGQSEAATYQEALVPAHLSSNANRAVK